MDSQCSSNCKRNAMLGNKNKKNNREERPMHEKVMKQRYSNL